MKDTVDVKNLIKMFQEKAINFNKALNCVCHSSLNNVSVSEVSTVSSVGRVSDSSQGHGFESHQGCGVMSLSKTGST